MFVIAFYLESGHNKPWLTLQIPTTGHLHRVTQWTDASLQYYCKTKEKTRLSTSVFVRESLRCLEGLAFDNCTNMTGEAFIMPSTSTVTSKQENQYLSVSFLCWKRYQQSVYVRVNKTKTNQSLASKPSNAAHCAVLTSMSMFCGRTHLHV